MPCCCCCYNILRQSSSNNHSNNKKWDIANGINSCKPAKYPITDAIVKDVTLIFKRLADEELLEGCKNVSNQNSNESFNNVLWSFCPKEQFNSPLTTSLAISVAICIYNSGLEYTLTNLLEKCNLEFNKNSLDQWSKMDKVRIVKGDNAGWEKRKKSTTKQKKTNHPTWCISEKWGHPISTTRIS